MFAKRGMAMVGLGLFLPSLLFANREERPRVDLVLVDQADILRTRLMARGRAALTREVERLFDGIGIDVDWLADRGESPIVRGRFELRVILVPTGPEKWGLAEDVMGAVNRKAASSRALYVFFPSVVRGFGGDAFSGGGIPSKRELEGLGRGLGRVVAHELVHALCPRLSHRPTGLMIAKLGRRQLRQARFRIESEIAALFRLRLEQALALGPLRQTR